MIGKTKKSIKFSDVVILLVIFIVLIIFFSLMNKQFFMYNNISSMLRNMVISGILALALTPLMIAQGIDISFGSVISFTSVIIALLYTNGLNLWLTLIIGIGIATIIGFINGVLIESFNLNPIIFSLGMMAIFQALALIFSNATSILMLTDQLFYFATASFLKIPLPVFVLIVFLAVLLFILNYTKIGRIIYVIGANPKLAFLSGINVKKTKIILYAFMGFSTGIASVLIISLTGVGYPYHGANLTLPILSAVLLGGISLLGGSGNVWGTLIGVLIVTVIFNGLSVLNVQSYFIQLFQGLALVIIVSTYELRHKKQLLIK